MISFLGSIGLAAIGIAAIVLAGIAAIYALSGLIVGIGFVVGGIVGKDTVLGGYADRWIEGEKKHHKVKAVRS